MGGFIFAAFVGVPILEIALFIEIGSAIGFWKTIGVVVLTALIGTALLQQQGLATLRKAQASLNENRFPMDEIFDGLCLIFAGALLLTPGFFTDAVGLLMFVPPFRAALRQGLGRFLATRGHVEVYGAGFSADPDAGPGAGPGVDRVINGDFKDITPDTDGSEKPAPTRKLPED